MSKITYLWGAGASRGQRRDREKRNNEDYIIRGVPVISEFENAVDDLLQKIHQNYYGNNTLEISGNQYIDLLTKKLQALKQICIDFPTVDTYARQLFVTRAMCEYKPIEDYEDLKHTISLFLSMIQLEKKRDPRYDGFISSVISNQGEMSPMTILSWNYDLQFEQAFAGYSLAYGKGKYIPRQWKYLNVKNKTYSVPCDENSPFSIVKLNGTATFLTGEDQELDGYHTEQMADCFFGRGEKSNCVEYALEVLKNNYANNLSYVWEEENLKNVIDYVKQRVANTEELIVIGYSFPYVNRTVDEVIMKSMPYLQKVWIQDPNFEEIEERVKTLLPNYQFVKIEHVRNMSQFKLPSSFYFLP